MVALNLNYNWDLLPQESSVYRVPPEIGRHLKTFHPDLFASWIAECIVCGRRRPGDLNHCPGCRAEGMPDQRIGGLWGLYLWWPMYYRMRWRGGTLMVIEKRPNLLSTCPPHELASRFLTTTARFTHGDIRNVYDLRNQIEAASARRMAYLKDAWQALHRDQRRQWQRVRRLLTDDPGSPMISTYIEGRTPHVASHA